MSASGDDPYVSGKKTLLFSLYMNGVNVFIQNDQFTKTGSGQNDTRKTFLKKGAFANEYLAGEYATNFVKGFQESNVDEDHLLVRAGTSNDIENGVFFALIPTW